MSEIHVYTQIGIDSLGDGWDDQTDAARRLAEVTRATWTADIEEFAERLGAKVRIGTEIVNYGCTGGPVVTAEGFGGEDDAEIEVRVAGLLTSMNEIWEKFCADE